MSDYRYGGRRRYADLDWHEPRHVITHPSVESLEELHGEPPWEIVLPDSEIVPSSATDLVGSIVWRGVRFVRERDE